MFLLNTDSCPITELGDVIDSSGCAITQLCPCEGQLDSASVLKNHGNYVSCVTKISKSFKRQGLITRAEISAIVSAAAKAQCGKK